MVHKVHKGSEKQKCVLESCCAHWLNSVVGSRAPSALLSSRGKKKEKAHKKMSPETMHGEVPLILGIYSIYAQVLLLSWAES